MNDAVTDDRKGIHTKLRHFPPPPEIRLRARFPIDGRLTTQNDADR